MSAHFFDRCLVLCVAILLPAFAALPAKAERVRCENAFLTDEADSQPRADIDQLLRQLIRALEPKSGVTAADLGVSQISVNLLALANRGELLNQTDPRLGREGLLVPNGGLCASACTVNLIGALAVPAGSAAKFSDVSPLIIQKIVELYPEMRKSATLEKAATPVRADLNELLNQLLNELQKQMPSRDNDARYGADPAVFTQSLTDLFQIYGATLLTRQKPTLDLMLEASRTDSIMLISANLFDAANSSVRPDVHGRHALLVLKLFPETSEIVISDPNNPNDIYRTRYTARSDGSIQFNTRLNYTVGGTIAIPYSVEIVQRPLGH